MGMFAFIDDGCVIAGVNDLRGVSRTLVNKKFDSESGAGRYNVEFMEGAGSRIVERFLLDLSVVPLLLTPSRKSNEQVNSSKESSLFMFSSFSIAALAAFPIELEDKVEVVAPLECRSRRFGMYDVEEEVSDSAAGESEEEEEEDGLKESSNKENSSWLLLVLLLLLLLNSVRRGREEVMSNCQFLFGGSVAVALIGCQEWRQ